MNNNLFRKVISLIITFCMIFSSISFVFGENGNDKVLTVASKSFMPPNPNVYPDFYKKDNKDITSNGTKNYSVPAESKTDKMEAPKQYLPSQGSVEKVLVIPISFSDTNFDAEHTKEYFEGKVKGTTNSLKDYYEKNSGYYYDHSKGITIEATVADCVTSIKNMDYYGADYYDIDSNQDNWDVSELAREAVRLLDAKDFDFNSFDKDKDGYIDHLIIIHSGAAQESSDSDSNTIWSHYSGIMGGEPVDDVIAENYLTVSEDSEIGAYCHEFGHDLGLPDLYDTDGAEFGKTQGAGIWDVMASGSWGGTPPGSCPSNLSAWCKMYLGWLTPQNITTDTSGAAITNTNGNSTVLRLWPRGSTSANEYFLAEYRTKTGYDAGLPGDGVLIWHIDEIVIINNIHFNQINCSKDRLGVELEQADGDRDLWKMNNRGDGGDPFPGSTGNKNFVKNPYLLNNTNISGNPFTYVDLLNISTSGEVASMDCYVEQNEPSATVAKFPATNFLATVHPAFSWNIATQTIYYNLQISEDKEFGTGLIDLNLSGSTLVYSDNSYIYNLTSQSLQSDKTYYWRVRGYNDFGYGKWSEVRRLDTYLSVPAAPTVTFSFDGVNAGKLMGITSAMEYSLDGGENYESANGNDVLLSADQIASITEGNDIYVRVKKTETEPYGYDTVIDIQSSPAAPNVLFSFNGPNAGKLMGITPLMEYSLDGGKNYITPSGIDILLSASEMSNISAENDIRVRITATAQTMTGNDAVIDIQPAPAAPNVTFTFGGPNAGKLMGITSLMEYSLDGGINYITPGGSDIMLSASEITSISPENDIRVRVKAASNTPAGTDRVFDIQPVPSAPSVTFSFDGVNAGKLMGITSAMEYSLNGGNNYTASTTANELLTASAIALITDTNDILVRVKATSTAKASSSTAINILPGPAAPAITFSFDGVNAGKLMGITSKMEYSLNGGTSFTGVASSNITLSAIERSSINSTNDIKVRIKATACTLAGITKTIDIFEGPATPPAITFSFDGTNAGKLMGITTNMEYSLNGGSYYIGASNPNITLSAIELSSINSTNDIKVRIKGTSCTASGIAQTIDILPGAASGVWADDTSNTVYGMDNTMEFSTDGSNWTRYNYNLPGLSGNVVLRVRKIATGIYTIGPINTITFTENSSGSSNQQSGGGGGGGGGGPAPAPFIPFIPGQVEENPLDVAQKNEPIDAAKAQKVTDYIATLSTGLNKTSTNESDKAAEIANVAGKLNDIAKIIGNTADAQAASKLISETNKLMDSLIAASVSIKEEENAVKAIKGLNTAIQSSNELLNIIKSDTDKKNTNEKIIGMVQSAAKTLDKINNNDKLVEAAESIIKSVNEIALKDKNSDLAKKLTEEANNLIKDVISDLGTSQQEAKVEGNTAKAEITAEKAQALTSQADTVAAAAKKFNTETKVVVDITNQEGVKSVSTTLPANCLLKLSLKKIDKLELKTSLATLSVAPDSIATKGASTVSFEVKEADKTKDLTAEQKKIIGSNTVFDFNAVLQSKNGKLTKVSSFSEPIEISIPYTLKKWQNPSKITVYFINDKGMLENQFGTYDPVTKTVVFKTNHFSKYVIKENTIKFSDLDKFKDYSKYIDTAAVNGIMTAKTKDQFAPGDTVTRAELADLLVKLFKLGDVNNKKLKANFTDVKPGSTYYGAIALVSNAGLMSGSGKKFNPSAKVSRQEVAIILANALKKYKGVTISGDTKKYLSFTDIAKLNAATKNSIAVMVKNGLMEAKTGKAFAPAGTINRAELAKIVSLILSIK